MAYEYKVKEVLRVVDGDTSRTRDPYEKYLGKEASGYLEEQLIEDNIIIKTEKDGKYGRMLGWLYREGEEISIQERMINKGYGWAYDGGTKEKSFAELREKRIADGSWTFPEPEEAGFQGIE